MLYVIRYKLHVSRGFTLIEVLITVALVTVLSTGVVLTLTGFLSNQNLELTAKEIAASLSDAQEKSMSQDSGSRWGVYVDNTGTQKSYSLFQVDEALIASSSFSGIPGTEQEHNPIHSNLMFEVPAEGSSTIVVFSKISGLPGASTTISVRLIREASSIRNIHIGGNGKIELQ